MNHFALGEVERLLANLIRVGVITDLDEANARVKVAVGGLTTDWLPWGTQRAGATRTWSAPRAGEQVLVFSPYGDPAQAIVGLSIFQDAHPAPATSQDKETVVFPDGTSVEHDSASNTYTLTVAGNGNVVVNCKVATVNAETSVTLDTPQVHCTGNLAVDGVMNVQGNGASGGAVSTFSGTIRVSGGDVEADSITLKGHGHIEQGDGNRTSNAVA